MTDNKQINLMIDVISELSNKNVSYEIIGDGENYEKLVMQAQKLNLCDKVTFHGWANDVLPITKRWHIFALPSINEDLPVAMLECMAQGIVPIASSVGGIITLLNKGKNGILCNSSDKNSFKDAVIKLAENKELYEKMSENCIETVKSGFLIDGAVHKTVAIYKEILA